jgi:hypothetical protein
MKKYSPPTVGATVVLPSIAYPPLTPTYVWNLGLLNFLNAPIPNET